MKDDSLFCLFINEHTAAPLEEIHYVDNLKARCSAKIGLILVEELRLCFTSSLILLSTLLSFKQVLYNFTRNTL